MSDFEDDLLNDLEADLESDTDEKVVEELKIDNSTSFESVERGDFGKFLTNLKKLSKKIDFSTIDITTVKPASISVISSEHVYISEEIAKLEVDFISILPKLVGILPQLIDILPIIKNDITNLFRLLTMLYHDKFSELQSLVTDPQEYCKIVKILEINTDKMDNITSILEADGQITKAKILILTMSMKTSFKSDIIVPQVKLFQIIDSINNLITIREEINKFIERNVDSLAPNLTALIGHELAALLLAHAGSVVELSSIPSCNLASVGKNKYTSHETKTNISGVRQEGYIYHSDLVLQQDISQRKKMLRMVCAKVSLASRIDAGQQNLSVKDNSMGAKWREELLLKIKKISEPPNVTDRKILAIPEDKPKKKRAGRKFRKYKEQFKLSHLRQLQNRVEFGKQEQTVMDSFGEEIGMGMIHTSLQKLSQVNSEIDRNVNNRAKLSKTMRARLNEFDSNRRE